MKNDERKTIWYIAIFCILVLAITFMAPWLGGSPSKPGLGVLLWGTAPLLVAVLMRTLTHDWSDAGLKPAIQDRSRLIQVEQNN